MSNERASVEHVKDYAGLSGYDAKLYLLRHYIKLNQGQQDAMMYSIRGPCMSAPDKGKADGSITARDNSVRRRSRIRINIKLKKTEWRSK